MRLFYFPFVFCVYSFFHWLDIEFYASSPVAAATQGKTHLQFAITTPNDNALLIVQSSSTAWTARILKDLCSSLFSYCKFNCFAPSPLPLLSIYIYI